MYDSAFANALDVRIVSISIAIVVSLHIHTVHPLLISGSTLGYHTVCLQAD